MSKHKQTTSTLNTIVSTAVAIVLVLVPFHAFLTVWAASVVGHYTALRLWKEALLFAVGLLAVYIFIRSRQLNKLFWRDWLWRLIVAFIAVNIVWGLVSYLRGGVTGKALLYGELLDIRPFAMLFIAWVAACGANWLYHNWQKLVLWPAAGVVTVGLLQYFVLPFDVMKHFGYGTDTISPYDTIDRKTEYIRIKSTLRGVNPLGGYLIIVLSTLGNMLFNKKRLALVGAAIVAALIVMFGSGSRGAWLGLMVATAVLLWIQLPSAKARKLAVGIGLAVVVVLAAGIIALRENDTVQNIVFHTDENSVSRESSNSAHVRYATDALAEIATEPLGRGPGTAGPAGVYNQGHPARIAENNFLQIGQETGWLGLGLFTAIFVLLARALWQRRELALAQVLLASMAGLTVMAMLMHIWTDDTIVYLFFGLAGIAIAQKPTHGHEAPK